jgi:hypothetical protein
LNITSLELEDPQYLAYEVPLSVRRQRLKAAQTDNMAGERARGKEGGRDGRTVGRKCQKHDLRPNGALLA